MRVFVASLLLFFVLCTGLYAQSASAELETLLAAEELTYAQAARFILQVSEVLVTNNPEEAFRYAAYRDWIPKNAKPDDTAQLGGVSLLLMQAFDLDGGIMYNISKTPHYALRELMYKNVVQSWADVYVRVSGEQLLFYIGRILNIRERDEMLADQRALERLAREAEDRDTLYVESFDFGLLINQYVATSGNSVDRDKFEYRLDAVPRIAFLLGNRGIFYASLRFTANFDERYFTDPTGEEYKILSYIPEVLRTEYFIRSGPWGLRVGRFSYSDPLTFIAEGLFDGIQGSHSSPMGHFSLGAWYTGVLYKKSANIYMTPAELDHFNSPIIIKDFLNTYFAPRRFVGAFDWSHPSLGGIVDLKAALIGQIDVNNIDYRYNSQYFALKAGVPFGAFLFEAGGTLGTSQSGVKGERLAFNNLSWAGEAAAHYSMPVSIPSRVSLIVRYATGIRMPGDFFELFLPITSKHYGELLQIRLSGVTIYTANYSARLFDSLGGNVSVSYFVRGNNIDISSLYPGVQTSSGKLLGGEVFTKLVWSPFSDLQFNLGSGIFLPSAGNFWIDGKPIWRIDLTTTFGVR